MDILKKLSLLLVIAALALLPGTVCAEKQTGVPNITAEELSGICVFNPDDPDAEYGADETDLTLSSANGEQEAVIDGRIEMISGGSIFEHAVNLVFVDDRAQIQFNMNGIREMGDAVYRLHAESEHYQAEYEFQVSFVHQKEITETLGFDTLMVPVSDEPVAMHSLFDALPIQAYPAMPVDWRLSGGRWLELSFNADEAELLLKNQDFDTNRLLDDTYLQIRQPGSYEMILYVYTGINRMLIRHPVTLEGVETSGAAGFELRNKPEEAAAADMASGADEPVPATEESRNQPAEETLIFEYNMPSDAERPDRNKQEVFCSTMSQDLGPKYYFYDLPDNPGSVINLAENGEALSFSDREDVIRGKIEFISGPEEMAGLIAFDPCDLGLSYEFHPETIREDCTGKYRIYLESEHYYQLFECEIICMKSGDFNVSCDEDHFTAYAGIDISSDEAEKMIGIHTEPDCLYSSQFLSENMDYAETEDYTIAGTACFKKNGDYPIVLAVYPGVNGAYYLPMTVYVKDAPTSPLLWGLEEEYQITLGETISVHLTQLNLDTEFLNSPIKKTTVRSVVSLLSGESVNDAGVSEKLGLRIREDDSDGNIYFDAWTSGVYEVRLQAEIENNAIEIDPIRISVQNPDGSVPSAPGETQTVSQAIRAGSAPFSGKKKKVNAQFKDMDSDFDGRFYYIPQTVPEFLRGTETTDGIKAGAVWKTVGWTIWLESGKTRETPQAFEIEWVSGDQDLLNAFEFYYDPERDSLGLSMHMDRWEKAGDVTFRLSLEGKKLFFRKEYTLHVLNWNQDPLFEIKDADQIHVIETGHESILVLSSVQIYTEFFTDYYYDICDRLAAKDSNFVKKYIDPMIIAEDEQHMQSNKAGYREERWMLDVPGEYTINISRNIGNIDYQHDFRLNVVYTPKIPEGTGETKEAGDGVTEDGNADAGGSESADTGILFYADTTKKTNIREKANKNSGLITTIGVGTKVAVLETLTGKDQKVWYKVQLEDGTTGYARNDFFTVSE